MAQVALQVRGLAPLPVPGVWSIRAADSRVPPCTASEPKAQAKHVLREGPEVCLASVDPAMAASRCGSGLPGARDI